MDRRALPLSRGGMIVVVCFLWHYDPAVTPRYTAAHVNALRRALADTLPLPHRMVCVTDNRDGLDPYIAVVKPDARLPREKRYAKLMLFRRDAADLFGGERLLFSDLDVTPVGDLSPVVDRPEDFVIWRDPLFGRRGYCYNSSLILLTAGCRPRVYENFDPLTSPEAVRGWVGSDQAWIGLTLGPDEAVWTAADGVLAYKHDVLPFDPTGRTWPEAARLIVSHGRPKPWDLDADHPLRQRWDRA